MKLKTSLLAASVLGLLSTTASAVDWNGYLRVGPGQKASHECYNSFVDGGTYRLGNECGTYGEFSLSQAMKSGAIDYKILMTNNFSYDGSSPDGDKAWGIPQLYVEGRGYDVAPNVTFWIGKRFWHRHDVHITDKFFTEPGGTGAGVDDINLGFGKLGVAVFRDNGDATAGGNDGTRVNANLSGIQTNPGGTLIVHAVVTDFSGAGGKSGFGLSLQHDQTGVLGGNNRAWLQYAQGSAYLRMNFGGATDDSDKKGYRLVESITWGNGPLSGQVLGLIGRYGTSGAKESFNTLGGRVGYAVTNNFKVSLEAGTSSSKPQGGTARRTTHITLAPALTVGPNFYDRPELRFYVTNNRFNEAMRVAQGRDKKSESAVGFQAEIWF